MGDLRVLTLTLALPSGAVAACSETETLYFACTFANAKTVEICHDSETARYSFGPAGEPELVIEVPVTDVHLTPWPGIGRDVWEEIIFVNQPYFYLIAPSIQREYPDNENAEITAIPGGALIVGRGDENQATLRCKPESVDFPWSTTLFDAKQARGQCYDAMARRWNSC